MFKVRAKKKDSDEVVTGWYCGQADTGDHWLILLGDRPHIDETLYGWEIPCGQIDFATAAVATGKPDKNDKEVFGLMGDFGGQNCADDLKVEYRRGVVHNNEPHILRGYAEYSESDCMWMFNYGHGTMPLCYVEPEDVEVVEQPESPTDAVLK